jgi:hypothetical protein
MDLERWERIDLLFGWQGHQVPQNVGHSAVRFVFSVSFSGGRLASTSYPKQKESLSGHNMAAAWPQKGRLLSRAPLSTFFRYYFTQQ